MKTLKYFSLVFLMLFSVRVMAQSEIKMMNGSVNIGDGKTYYFFDSGGEEEMTVEEDPINEYRWKTWYQHNESYVLHLKVPTGSNKGIKVTFRFLNINNDNLRIFEGAPSDTSASNLIANLTNNDYAKDYTIENFSVMSHGDMTICFKSDYHWADAGWWATIKLDNYKPQAPIALKEACANNIHLLTTSKGDIRYTLNGNNPTASSTLYEFDENHVDKNPIAITATTTIKAIMVDNDNNISDVAVSEHDLSTFKPTVPQVTRKDNTNIVEIKSNKDVNLMDTWYVRYTTDGDDPTGSTATEVQDETTIELTQPCTLKVVTRGTTCPTIFSDPNEKPYNTIYIPNPTIKINNNIATITCSMSDATIYYTTDGTSPDASNYTGNGTSQVTTNTLNLGQTVKAIAIYNATGYQNSDVVSEVNVGNGSGVSGSIVLLDDREDHSWSYYSDKDNPIRSLNPADVKITYFGNGTGTVTTSSDANPGAGTWTQNATGVQVSYNETANQFVYLKTLERVDGTTSTTPTGRCEYTTIPNPFSKRPTYGSGDTRWRGFYGWRIKSIRGGKIYSAATGGIEYTAYTSGNLANTNYLTAEGTYYFAPDAETGMEVELEALWARAYVVANRASYLEYYINSNGLQGGSYERNFYVFTGTYNTDDINETQKPLTISSRYPDGTAAGTNSRVQGDFTCNADTKFEYVVFRGGNNYCATLTANNHNLVIGRGVTGYNNGICANTVQGISGNAANLDYTIRVESGSFTNFAMMRQGSATCTGVNSARAILGSDYDRANNNDNDKLKITGTMYGGSSNHAFSTATNRNNLTFDWLIKSGYFQGNVGTATGAQSIYMGTPGDGNTQNSVQYQGKRRLILEGGSVANIAGGINCYENNYANYMVNDGSWAVMIRMKGGTVRGVVYGAAQFAGSSGDRRFVFTGGNVAGWIAGGCNGTNTDGGELYGNTYIYFGGNAQCNSNGSNTTIGPGQATGGNIFGAGSGNSGATGDNATVGRVNSSTIVIADKAVVERNVYGGGNYGYVRNGETNKSDIYVLGGEVKGSVFGGSNMQKGQIVNITMQNGIVEGSVYGGSNTRGDVAGPVAVNIIGGEVKGNVHGGGYGQNTNVAGNVEVTIGEKDAENGPTIGEIDEDGEITKGGDVYGGGALGKVNTGNPSNTTKVTINAGTMNNVYGGGLGQQGTGNNNIAANVGTVTVTINGSKINKVFGCNNLNGAPQGSVTVRFNGGEAVDVYGGGNEANYRTTDCFPTVYIDGGKVTNAVYGGGSKAEVNKTIVYMTNGEVTNVFAGAEGNNKAKTLVYGNKTLNMQGGTAITVYGGSYTCQDQDYSFVNISGGRVKTHVFGSGYFGNMSGDCYVCIGKNAIEKAPYNGGNGDKFKTADLSDEKPIWIEGNIYAGANWGSYEGTFGEATINGKSNIYIDGIGYNMDHGKTGNYMIIGGSVFGSGTSCEAGKTDHSVIVRNYGTMTYPSMTRSLKSIQRVKELILDNSNIEFIGQGDISSMDITVEYGICNINNIRVANGSNIALSKPMDMTLELGSYTCTDVYANTPSFTKTTYTTPSNGIVINNGGYLMIRNNKEEKIYGELIGFFNMREPGDDAGINNEGYIFARPRYKQYEGSYYWSATPEASPYNVYVNDGGFVDFDATEDDPGRNTFDENGNEVRTRKVTQGAPVQMPYTNRTAKPTAENGVDPTSYRYWRYDPDVDYPVVTREVVFVVKADEDAGSTSTKFLTTSDKVQLPPTLDNTHLYYITDLTWGTDGKDCNPASVTKTKTEGEWLYYDADRGENDPVYGTTTSPDAKDIEEYYSNPNSTFGFLMQFKGNLKSTTNTDQILDNNSFESYYKYNAMAEVDVNGNNTTDLPQLEFVVTYSDRLSQNELWSEARVTIDEIDPATGKTKQRIYLNISVTTNTKFGQNVETYVYASTEGTAVDKYIASVTLPTFDIADKTILEGATFKIKSKSSNGPLGFETTDPIQIVSWDNVAPANPVAKPTNAYFALHFNAETNGDNTNGWNNMGNPENPARPVTYDFNTVPNSTVLGSADGRKYTTIQFELQYDPRELAKMDEFKLGQKYVGDLVITMNVDNIAGNEDGEEFDIIVHVYVTGPTKFFYLDGIAGRDGNSGMFPDQAKKTFNGVINANGYTVKDPIFVVNGVEPKAHGTLTWNADKFLNAVKVEDDELENYTEEELRQLSQVKVYRYPGNHPKEDGTTGNTMGKDENDNDIVTFNNGMFTGQIINVPANTKFNMSNVCISGGTDLNSNKDYNPAEATLHANYPLISIEEDAIVTITNSSLVYNNNDGTTKAGAIYNEGSLTVDGIYISNNTSVAEEGKGAGIYQADSMILGNTQTITIADQIYLADRKMMCAPYGYLAEKSKLSDILVYCEQKPLDSYYSGRVIVRYPNHTPSAPEVPYWKGIIPQNQSSILKNRKEATETKESDKYLLNSYLKDAYTLANGGDENVLPFITDNMSADYDPITNHDIIMYSIQANLPVELLYFTAECMGEATQLQWSTASETNNEYFTIERSSDAVNYEEVAHIQGAGTTSQRNDYSFMVDNNSTAITYYRLRQTDIDGKYEIFAPIAIQCQNEKAATEISIYPVPANDQVNIFSSNSPMTRIEIYSIMGAKVAEESAEGNQTTLHIGNLATGVYAVKVFTEDGQVSNVRLIKK